MTSGLASEQGIAPSRPVSSRLVWWHALALATATALAFVPAIGNGFVTWDDDRNFLENPSFTGLSPGTVRWAWTTSLLGVYQPLGWLLMEAEFDAWGLNPRGYHAASMALHAANAVVLWVLTLALLKRVSPGEAQGSADRCARRVSASAAIAAALYAVHPLRAEVVAWVSCQTYLPSALFAMLAAVAYLAACNDDRPSGRLVWLVAAWVLYTLGLLMKVVPIMLPGILLVLDVYPLRRLGAGRWTGREAWRVYKEKLPFLAVALPMAVIALRARGVDDFSNMNATDYDPVVRLARAGVAPGFYLLKTAYPFGLGAIYPPPRGRIGYLGGISAAAIATTLLATIAAFALRRRWPGLTAAWACYLVALAPNLGLVRTGRSFLKRTELRLPTSRYRLPSGSLLARYRPLPAGGAPEGVGAWPRGRARRRPLGAHVAAVPRLAVNRDPLDRGLSVSPGRSPGQHGGFGVAHDQQRKSRVEAKAHTSSAP